MGVCYGCEALGAWGIRQMSTRGEGTVGNDLWTRGHMAMGGAWFGAASLCRGEGSGPLWPGWPAMTWCGVKRGRGQRCVWCVG